MTSRVLIGALALSLVAGACGLGDKQAQADRITAAGKALMGRPSVAASIGVRVRVLPVERQLVEVEPPRISPGTVEQLESLLHPPANTASVQDVLLFVDDVVYQRIAPNRVGAPVNAAGAPSNLNAIFVAVNGGTIVGERVAPTTTTTAARRLRRGVQIVRQWAAFDFAEIEDRDRTKHGGSFAVNPVAALRLATGVLTGSVERTGEGSFKANVSRDKAERNLSEDAREVLDKMFTANAITRRVFPARFQFDDDGELRFFSVTMRQQLSSKDRADLTMSFAFRPSQDRGTIGRPPRRGTVTANTLAELVTMVTGA